jgi:hypothetical protein
MITSTSLIAMKRMDITFPSDGMEIKVCVMYGTFAAQSLHVEAVQDWYDYGKLG